MTKTTARVLSEMGSTDSAHLISMRNMVIKDRSERNETARVATFNSTIAKISFFTIIAVVIMATTNPAPILAVWEKIAPYILL